MQIPPGYSNTHNTNNSVCKLRKSLYDLGLGNSHKSSNNPDILNEMEITHYFINI